MLGIGYNAAYNIAVGVTVDIRHVQPLYMAERAAANVFNSVVCNFIIDNAHYPLQNAARRRADENFHKRGHNYRHIDLAARHSVNCVARQHWNIQVKHHTCGREQQRNRYKRS